MAKVLATSYRYVEVTDEEKGIAKRTIYSPGESPDGLPSDVVKDLDERGLLVDERRFSKELGIVLPDAEAVKRYEAEAQVTEGGGNQAPKTSTASTTSKPDDGGDQSKDSK